MIGINKKDILYITQIFFDSYIGSSFSWNTRLEKFFNDFF